MSEVLVESGISLHLCSMSGKTNILDQYTLKKPEPQTCIDLFAGEWSSALPDLGGAKLTSGQAALFDDQRIKMLQEFYSLYGKNILELGPLEAGHTYMMHQAGAKHITAIEANSRAFLKCLLVKELYQLNRTSFLHGEVMAYLQDCTERFDLCVASGILYHMMQPSVFLESCSRISNRLFIWTHYAIPEMIDQHPVLKKKIKRKHRQTFRGYEYDEYEYSYTDALGWDGFCGGTAETCRWITKDALLHILAQCGLSQVHVFFDDIASHPNGPNICLMAEIPHS